MTIENLSVLLVDDTELLLNSLSAVLRRLGFSNIKSALNAAEAIRLIEAEDNSFDIMCELLSPKGLSVKPN